MYIVAVGILMVLAISGLVVGVSNDAINFLNSAVGSKAAPRRVILGIASVGMIVGALTSGGMMEVARSGVFYPAQFSFSEIMMLFLGVMFANVILLDLFNTFGLPTSTTVSLVFGLLGAGLAAATVKIAGDDSLTVANLGSFINSGSTLVIVSGILLSVALAFAGGSIIMYITRILFTFRYKKVFRNFGYLWCGVAFTAIVYFALFKGLKSSGLALDQFGDDAVAIFEKPADWDLDWTRLLRDIADEVAAHGASAQLQEKLHLKLANYACHHSVRAGQKMDHVQMDALLRDIENTERAGQCNHGRPVYKVVSIGELDKMFERI